MLPQQRTADAIGPGMSEPTMTDGAKSEIQKSQLSRHDHENGAENFAIFRITQLGNTLSRGANNYYGKHFGVSVIALRVVTLLGSTGPMTVNELSRATSVDKGWISRAVAKLIRQGHISRRQDPADQRRYSLRLEVSGENVHRQMREMALGRQEWFLSALNSDERDQFMTLIEKLQIQAEFMLNHADPTE